MPTSREILESTYRAGRMKKVRVFVYIAQTVLTIIMLIILTMLTPEAGFFPLYLPFEGYFFIIAMMILVIVAEGFFFKLFGIRWSKSDSEKFLMAKDHIRRGIVVIVIAVVIIALANLLISIAYENIDTTETVVVDSTYNVTFSSQDAFAITGITSITLTSDDEPPILLDVYILHEDDYLNEDYDRRLNPYPSESINRERLDYERDSYLPYGDYVLYINAKGSTANVTYALGRSVSQTIRLYLTIFPGIFAGMNAVWVMYLRPLKKRYEKTSIYE